MLSHNNPLLSFVLSNFVYKYLKYLQVILLKQNGTYICSIERDSGLYRLKQTAANDEWVI